MSPIATTIIAVGVGLAAIIVVAASSIESRLNRIIRLLEIANEERD